MPIGQQFLLDYTIANIAYQYIFLRDEDIAALKSHGMVEDEGQLGLGFRISRAIKEEARGNNWTMPDNLVGRDESGRLIHVGNPRTRYELAERIARVLDRKIIWATVKGVRRFASLS